MSDLTLKTLQQLVRGLESREFSCYELATAYADKILKTDVYINAYLETNLENTVKQAKAVDLQRAKNEHPSPLAGIPFAVKDNISVKDTKTTCGSKILENYIAPYDATVISKLKSQGMIVIGKTNMDEFGMGASGENSAFKTTKNPYNLHRTPGGSSSGSAAAVASNQAPIALGSDTGGSVRQPASFCGLVGIKPTYGSVSRYGLVSFAPSLDQIGVISKTVYDNALLLSACMGQDKMDARSIKSSPPNCTTDIHGGIKGMTVGLDSRIFEMDISVEVKTAVMKTADKLKDMGCKIIDCRLPDSHRLIACYYLLSCAEASSNLARYDGIRYGRRSDTFQGIDDLYVNSRTEGFGREVKNRIMLGSFALSAGYYQKYYLSALELKKIITTEYMDILKQCDAILTPTYPTVAFKLGIERTSLDSFKGDMFTVGANLSGLPAINIPSGYYSEGMPIGISLMGKANAEPTLYRIANGIEAVLTDKGGRT